MSQCHKIKCKLLRFPELFIRPDGKAVVDAQVMESAVSYKVNYTLRSGGK